jgi:sugar lactone lactonase YvrE
VVRLRQLPATALIFLASVAVPVPAADPPAAAPAYRITTLAGTGKAGYDGDGGPAVAAKLNHPTSVDVDRAGNVFIADSANHRIRKVAPDGTIATFAGTGQSGFSGDGGPAAAAQLSGPYGVRVDGRGNVYIADSRNRRVRKVTPDGIITTVAGDGGREARGEGGPATAASLGSPVDMVADGAGNLYVACTDVVNVVWKVTPDGLVHAAAGTAKRRAAGESTYGGDGGPATAARLNVPGALALDRDGNLYIADLRNHAVRKVGADGVIRTVAGTGKPGFDGDGGPAAAARLREPAGVAFGADGSLFIADGVNYRVRRVGPDGVIRTVAGSGKRGQPGGDGPALAAALGVLDILALDAAGNVYVADYSGNRVHKLAPVPAGEK